jgi:hypothetical protein
LQHFAQPAASVQHFAQVAWSLQQLPLQAAAGFEQEPSLQDAQPVAKRPPTASREARSIVFMLFLSVVPWVLFFCPLPPRRPQANVFSEVARVR